MELYLQHFFFFFRSHNFKKPYITSFNRKKALIEKEDTRNMVILTLLPKIDILRLTKRHHQKELRSLWLAYCISLLGQRKWKASARPPPHFAPALPPARSSCTWKSIQSQNWYQNIESNITISASFKSENRIQTSKKSFFFKEKNTLI